MLSIFSVEEFKLLQNFLWCSAFFFFLLERGKKKGQLYTFTHTKRLGNLHYGYGDGNHFIMDQSYYSHLIYLTYLQMYSKHQFLEGVIHEERRTFLLRNLWFTAPLGNQTIDLSSDPVFLFTYLNLYNKTSYSFQTCTLLEVEKM